MAPSRARRRLLGLALLGPLALAQTKNAAEQLGYPADTKLLIVHADDLAVSHSQDRASFAALDRHAASAASIMVPCPWLTEVAEYAKAHPGADLGLHLTLTSEWQSYRWGPVASLNEVPGLARCRRKSLAGCPVCGEARQLRRGREGNPRAGRAGYESWHPPDTFG